MAFYKYKKVNGTWNLPVTGSRCFSRPSRVFFLVLSLCLVAYTLIFRRHDLKVIGTIVPRLNVIMKHVIPRQVNNLGQRTPVDTDEPVKSPLWRLPIEEIGRKSVKGDILDYLPGYKNPCWFMSTVDIEGIRCLPYFYLAGVAKSGTTAFYDQLIKHPDIATPTVKEPFFFGTPKKRNLEGYLNMLSDARKQIYLQSVDGYHKKITFDASPTYFAENGAVDKYEHNLVSGEPRYTLPHTLYALYPKTKIILSLRNPTQRLFSEYHYHMFHSLVGLGKKYSMKNFHLRAVTAVKLMKDCLAVRTVRSCIYDSDLFGQIMQGQKFRLNYGMYYPYAKEWLSVFPRDQILFIKAEEFYANGSSIMKEAFRFLGLQDTPDSVLEDIDQHTSDIYQREKTKVKKGASYRTKMWPETRKLLDDFYRPYNEQLVSLLGHNKWLFE